MLNPGTPDAAVNMYDPALGRSHVVFFEDGSCEPYQNLLAQESARTDRGDDLERLMRWRAAWALMTYHPSGNSFIPTEIERTMDR